eukprot:gene16208-22372_t
MTPRTRSTKQSEELALLQETQQANRISALEEAIALASKAIAETEKAVGLTLETCNAMRPASSDCVPESALPQAALPLEPAGPYQETDHEPSEPATPTYGPARSIALAQEPSGPSVPTHDPSARAIALVYKTTHEHSGPSVPTHDLAATSLLSPTMNLAKRRGGAEREKGPEEGELSSQLYTFYMTRHNGGLTTFWTEAAASRAIMDRRLQTRQAWQGLARGHPAVYAVFVRQMEINHVKQLSIIKVVVDWYDAFSPFGQSTTSNNCLSARPLLSPWLSATYGGPKIHPKARAAYDPHPDVALSPLITQG